MELIQSISSSATLTRLTSINDGDDDDVPLLRGSLNADDDYIDDKNVNNKDASSIQNKRAQQIAKDEAKVSAMRCICL